MKNTKEKVVIYVKQSCPHCIATKRLLNEKGIQYKEIDVIKNPDSFHNIKLKYSVKTVPQIFITDQDGKQIHIKGNDELQRLNKEGKLDDMLNHNDDQNDDQVAITTQTDNSTGYEECSTHNDDLI